MRCKCCDKAMDEHEIIWYEDRQEHEDMCVSCRHTVLEMEFQHVVDTFNPDDDIIDQLVPKSKSD